MRTPLAALTIAIALAVPAAASAADYYVSTSGSDVGSGGAAPTCSLAAPCLTIQTAVTAAHADSDADTIHVGTGQFSGATDGVLLNGSDDTNLTIDGSGDSTEIEATTGHFAIRLIQGASATVSHVRLDVPATLGDGTGAAYVGLGSSIQLSDSTVSVDSSTHTGLTGITVFATGAATLDHVTASMNAATRGNLIVSSGATTITNSTLTQNNPAAAVDTVDVHGGSLSIATSTLHQEPTTGAGTRGVILVQNANASTSLPVTLDDDLVTGGDTAFYTASTAPSATIPLLLRNDTFVPSTLAGALLQDVSNQPGTPVSLSLSLSNSIVRGTLPLPAAVAVTDCDDNDFPGGTVVPMACTGTTNADGTGVLFAGGGYDLAPGSAVIDSGDSSTPVAGEPATDILGRPRFTPGDGSCGAGVRDRGAYEYQGAGTVPTLKLTAPDSAVTGTPAQFSATTSGSPSYLWSFGDGSTSTTAGAVSHTYTSSGDKVVSLTVSNTGAGCSATQTHTVHVSDPPPPPPAAVVVVPPGTIPSIAPIPLTIAGSVVPPPPPPAAVPASASFKKPASKLKLGKPLKLTLTLTAPAKIKITFSGSACKTTKSKSKSKTKSKTASCPTFSRSYAAGKFALEISTKKMKPGRLTFTATGTYSDGTNAKTEPKPIKSYVGHVTLNR